MSISQHEQPHYIHRTGWLRASVLGANDGIISVTSLVLGMAASGASNHTLFISCIAGLIAGALSMAAGEYISVKSQSDIEEADLKFEANELEKNPHLELAELTQIYIQRGVNPKLAHEVAVELMDHDALQAHARDEIGINEMTSAKPILAAWSSALSFSLGAFFPLMAILFSSAENLMLIVGLVGACSLGLLGVMSGYFTGTSMLKGCIRVMLWGIAAMLLTSWLGSLFNV
ncbi:hypothetical protein AMD27_06015 [Acinetobacter sp. TGL-Y2]|uniref:VIT1/CCC1 transporter family protein n=1 Tax=Acinetobacter sp. TGL-Y2 TaxID=1407071 RepID=UPI0007A65958|nr:VIT family protein [Acinetobacter sp. TGL-Y2]AMW78485.1 hypothetical protein AMD27_06015 [Acinetobacter sp. TGL-Y2]